jgi:hypothetical protein
VKIVANQQRNIEKAPNSLRGLGLGIYNQKPTLLLHNGLAIPLQQDLGNARQNLGRRRLKSSRMKA